MCGHVGWQLESTEVSWDTGLKLTQGGALGEAREVSLGVAHLIFINDPYDINILMKLAKVTTWQSVTNSDGEKLMKGLRVEKPLDLKDRI